MLSAEALEAKAFRPVPHRFLWAGSRHLALIRGLLHRHDGWFVAGGGAKLGLLRQRGMNGRDGEKAERKKAASHDVFLSHMLRMAGG